MHLFPVTNRREHHRKPSESFGIREFIRRWDKKISENVVNR